MAQSLKTKTLRIGGMTCVNCQNTIEKKLRNTAGIQKAEVRYSAGTASITYDRDIISMKDVEAIIQKLDYQVLTGDQRPASALGRTAGFVALIAALYLLMEQTGALNLLAPSQLAEANMEYGMLFVIGLITSVHCVAMCGGINLSQCIPKGEPAEGGGRFSALRSTFLYNLGRVLSYTTVGFAVGALGSAITFSNTAQGALKLIAGVFMVIMGVNMLGIFPWLRRLNPRMPRAFARKVNLEKARSSSPLIVGLLNGFMPCGPLQAMQIYALSTGNPFAGALSMLLFSLGTVPLMFALGALSSVIGQKFTKKVMTAGAVLVAVLGLSMLSQGLSLSGVEIPLLPGTSAARNNAMDAGSAAEDGVQVVRSTLLPGQYPAITVSAGTPVKWIIDAPQGSVNGCNNRIFINEYGIEYSFKTGENVIEFTPEQAGTFRYSCWMGMIRSTITVLESGAEAPPAGDASQDAGLTYGFDAFAEPVPAGYTIPTDAVAIAEKETDEGYEYQSVTIELTGKGFSPAIAVVQAGVETEWIVDSVPDRGANASLLVPAYATAVPLEAGENALMLFPTESFEFSNGENTFYGFIKVVEDLEQIDIQAIKAEAAAFDTLIYPPEYFGGAGGASCH